MTVIPNTKNYYEDEDRNKPDHFGYDLQEEKKRIAQATEEIKKELLEKWQEKYAGAQIFPNNLSNINSNLVDFLLSFDNTLFYNDLAKKFGLNQLQRDMLPQIVWEISINRNWEGANNLLVSKLGLNPEVSNQIAQSINQNILLKARELSESKVVSEKRVIAGEQKNEARNANFSLLQALQQYPRFGEQLITSLPIKLKIFPSPVRPSIKNWIEDYRTVMGAQKHGMMERGNYLFHSENTKMLTSGDRKKLAEVLRSLDEDVSLKIDPDRQEVVFEATEERKPMEKMLNYQAEFSREKFPIINKPSVGQNSQISNANFSPKTEKDIPRNIPSASYGSQNINRPFFNSVPERKEESFSQIKNQNSQILPPQWNSVKAVENNPQNQNNNTQNFSHPENSGKQPQARPAFSSQIPNPNPVRFSSPQTFSGERKDMNQPDNQSNSNRNFTINRPQSVNSLAGKSWEELEKERKLKSNATEPKIRGNVVDLKG